MKKLICPFLALTLFISCAKESSDSDIASTSDNAMTSTYSKVATSANKIGGLAPTTSLALDKFDDSYNKAATAFGNEWGVTATMPDSTTNASDMTTAKEWMGHQISKDAVRENGSSISIFGRLTGTLGVFCAIGVAYGEDNVDADGYPKDGTQVVTIASTIIAQIATKCGFDASDAAGEQMTFTVSTPTDTTMYDKKVILTPPNGGTQTVYFRSTATEVNVASLEIYAHEENSLASVNYLGRTIVELDITNSVLRAEYVSGVNEGAIANGQRIEFSRILFDETNDEGYIMYMGYEKDSPSTTTEYVLTGKPSTDSSHFALSFISDSLSSTSERQMCVNSDDGTNAGTDGTFCSAVNGVSLAGMSVTGATALTDLKASYNSENFNGLSEATDLTFTSTDFATAEFSTK